MLNRNVPAQKYSANLHEAKFESSRTSRASQSSAIDNRDSVRIGKRNDVTTTEGSVSPTKKKSFKREHISHVPLKSSEQKTQPNRNVARNLRRRISDTDDANFKKYDTDRVQKDVPKDVPKKAEQKKFKKSDLDVPSDEIVNYPPPNNDREQPKTDFTSTEDEAEEYEYEFPKEKFNAAPLPVIESNDETNGEYMLTFNYKGSKKDQPKDVIKLSDSISKNGYAKKAQIIPEKKLSFKKSEKLKTELHAVRNERTGHEKVPHVAKTEFSKRFKTLPDNGLDFKKPPSKQKITRNYDPDITTPKLNSL
ncbi:uncharacterized protein TNIN_184591 [Trichonephila inaurata madagascariensis]|uniref:Uncharacterized protein n=1 Tax=Trichonephila inaurata madagascariensis TaxID=2747483 RepID=A0A8X7C586_9ARAC|nr:uncharacterized protein TNIN_184591 [Trichonephila inaurata madagascariensis]